MLVFLIKGGNIMKNYYELFEEKKEELKNIDSLPTNESSNQLMNEIYEKIILERKIPEGIEVMLDNVKSKEELNGLQAIAFSIYESPNGKDEKNYFYQLDYCGIDLFDGKNNYYTLLALLKKNLECYGVMMYVDLTHCDYFGKRTYNVLILGTIKQLIDMYYKEKQRLEYVQNDENKKIKC